MGMIPRSLMQVKMKSLLFFLFFFAAANAISLSGLQEMLTGMINEKREVTLQEYLEDLDEPHPLYRTTRTTFGRQGVCTNVCVDTPTIPTNSSKTCFAWAPNYELKGDDNQCECLTSYKCSDGKCVPPNIEDCKAGDQKGKKYGKLIKDCCDCDVLQCIDCEPP